MKNEKHKMYTEKMTVNKCITLFSATTNGVCFFFRRLMDSMVCGSKPCIISTTKIAISHKFEPRDRKLLKQMKF